MMITPFGRLRYALDGLKVVEGQRGQVSWVMVMDDDNVRWRFVMYG